jgi:hypothetical protein
MSGHDDGPDTGTGRAGGGSAGWRLHHHLCIMAVDLSDQRAAPIGIIGLICALLFIKNY